VGIERQHAALDRNVRRRRLSTVGDFFRFGEALLSGKLISKASLALMTTPVLQQYGFGMIMQDTGPRRSFGHGGGAPSQNGELRIFPELGYIVVALSNFDPPAASRLVEYTVARLPLPELPARKPIVVDDFRIGSSDRLAHGIAWLGSLVRVSGRPNCARTVAVGS
jgi:CubicO group peptidase (beta-lactamase class C family)